MFFLLVSVGRSYFIDSSAEGAGNVFLFIFIEKFVATKAATDVSFFPSVYLDKL